MLAHRLRRRPNIGPTLGRWFVFAVRSRSTKHLNSCGMEGNPADEHNMSLAKEWLKTHLRSMCSRS